MIDWRERALELKFHENLSWNEVYNEFPDIKPSAIRSHLRRSSEYKSEDKPVGIIGDLHIPFIHPNYLDFIKATFRQFNVGKVVFIGDLFDHYCYSRFIKKPIAMKPAEEKELARSQISKWCKAFPVASVCLGNHDTRYIDRAEDFGIDPELLKDFRDIYGLPDTWEIYDEYDNPLIMDDVLYIHGSAYNGEKGAKKAAINEQMSTVIGHGHSFAGVWPIANKRKLMFGMNVGAGIDIGAYAFAYNQKDQFRPLLGCGIVFSSNYATWVPMGKNFFRS